MIQSKSPSTLSICCIDAIGLVHQRSVYSRIRTPIQKVGSSEVCHLEILKSPQLRMYIYQEANLGHREDKMFR